MKINDLTRKWALFFLLDAIILFSAIILSKWTLVNNVPRRYFTCTYIAFSFAMLMLFDNLVINKTGTNLLKTFLIITVLICGAGTIYNLKFI